MPARDGGGLKRRRGAACGPPRTVGGRGRRTENRAFHIRTKVSVDRPGNGAKFCEMGGRLFWAILGGWCHGCRRTPKGLLVPSQSAGTRLGALVGRNSKKKIRAKFLCLGPGNEWTSGRFDVTRKTFGASGSTKRKFRPMIFFSALCWAGEVSWGRFEPCACCG